MRWVGIPQLLPGEPGGKARHAKTVSRQRTRPAGRRSSWSRVRDSPRYSSCNTSRPPYNQTPVPAAPTAIGSARTSCRRHSPGVHAMASIPGGRGGSRSSDPAARPAGRRPPRAHPRRSTG
jgi:hypothetical protein